MPKKTVSQMRTETRDNFMKEVMELLHKDREAVMHAMQVIEEDNAMLMERLAEETDIIGLFISDDQNPENQDKGEQLKNLLQIYKSL